MLEYFNEYWVIFFLLSIIIICIYVIQNIYIKYIKLEAWVLNIHVALVQLLQDLRKLDKREMFEKDDDVGMLWEQIVNLIGRLENHTIKK